jgi:hypothetical protein
MSLYLGTASQLDERGQIYAHPTQVADFALHALQKEEMDTHDLV